MSQKEDSYSSLDESGEDSSIEDLTEHPQLVAYLGTLKSEPPDKLDIKLKELEQELRVQEQAEKVM